MEKNIAHIQSQEFLDEREANKRRDRVAIRKLRARRPRQSPAFNKEYKMCLSFAQGSGFENARDRVCFLLLFLTGIRVRWLLSTTGAPLAIFLNVSKKPVNQIYTLLDCRPSPLNSCVLAPA